MYCKIVNHISVNQNTLKKHREYQLTNSLHFLSKKYSWPNLQGNVHYPLLPFLHGFVIQFVSWSGIWFPILLPIHLYFFFGLKFCPYFAPYPAWYLVYSYNPFAFL